MDYSQKSHYSTAACSARMKWILNILSQLWRNMTGRESYGFVSFHQSSNAHWLWQWYWLAHTHTHTLAVAGQNALHRLIYDWMRNCSVDIALHKVMLSTSFPSLRPSVCVCDIVKFERFENNIESYQIEWVEPARPPVAGHQLRGGWRRFTHSPIESKALGLSGQHIYTRFVRCQ